MAPGRVTLGSIEWPETRRTDQKLTGDCIFDENCDRANASGPGSKNCKRRALHTDFRRDQECPKSGNIGVLGFLGSDRDPGCIAKLTKASLGEVLPR
jgi:hypothetical protein